MDAALVHESTRHDMVICKVTGQEPVVRVDRQLSHKDLGGRLAVVPRRRVRGEGALRGRDAQAQPEHELRRRGRGVSTLTFTSVFDLAAECCSHRASFMRTKGGGCSSAGSAPLSSSSDEVVRSTTSP